MEIIAWGVISGTCLLMIVDEGGYRSVSHVRARSSNESSLGVEVSRLKPTSSCAWVTRKGWLLLDWPCRSHELSQVLDSG